GAFIVGYDAGRTWLYTLPLRDALPISFWISTVATGPRLLSSSASTIVPTAGAFGLAFRSSRSATSRIISSRPSMFSFDLAETSRSEEHTSELQSRENLVCRLLLEKKKQ